MPKGGGESLMAAQEDIIFFKKYVFKVSLFCSIFVIWDIFWQEGTEGWHTLMFEAWLWLLVTPFQDATGMFAICSKYNEMLALSYETVWVISSCVQHFRSELLKF